MKPPRPGYRAFLLRLWQTPVDQCRVSLEDAHTGQRHVFASLAELVEFLEKHAGGQDPCESAAGFEPDD